MELLNVAYAPKRIYHLPSLRMAVVQGPTYISDENGIVVNIKSGQTLMVPIVGDMHVQYGQGVGSERGCAVISPGLPPTIDVDINDYHRSSAHVHDRFAEKRRGKRGVRLMPGVTLPP